MHLIRNDRLFFIGKPWSGTFIHAHGSAWNGLVYGEKLWFLIPPSESYLGGEHMWDGDVPGLSMAEWVERVMPVIAGTCSQHSKSHGGFL